MKSKIFITKHLDRNAQVLNTITNNCRNMTNETFGIIFPFIILCMSKTRTLSGVFLMSYNMCMAVQEK